MTLLPPMAAAGHLALTESELTDWGYRLGGQIFPPLMVTLAGDLGAGKTTLARAICRGYGVADAVTSPTFDIVHEYAAPRSTVCHVDLYRLGGPADLQNIGWDDLVRSGALLIVEWPERAQHRLPVNHLPIELRHISGDTGRRVLYAGGHVAGQPGGTR